MGLEATQILVENRPSMAESNWPAGVVVREKYRILSWIGAGGMAAVYRTEHIHFGEVRALKVINR